MTKTKTTVYLDEDVLRGARVMAARTGKKDYEVVEEALRAYLGDGNFGGWYQRPDAEMLEIWQIAVGETRALIENNWE